MTLTALDRSTSPPTPRELECDSTGALRVSGAPAPGGTASGGLTNTELRAAPVAVSGPVTDVQLRASALPVSASTLPLPTGAATAANQATANTAFGGPADARATWYDTAASIIQILKLAVAAFVGAGSRTYTYTNGQLTSEAWTLFGTTRTKTYTYTGGVLTGESDWV